VNDNQKIMQWLNQTVNGLKPTEEKEFYFNSDYAGRKVTIKVKIDALNSNTETSSPEQS
tara:strand:- start:502 stop:678 length:177 start_codon:yes stop_codon:yes gene_type:complete